MEKFAPSQDAQPVIAVVAVCILTAHLAHLPLEIGGYGPIFAEWFCWVLVATWYEVSPRLGNEQWKNTAWIQTQPLKWLPWIAAGSITTVALSSSVVDSRIIMPIVTVCLAVFRELRVLPQLHEPVPKYLRTVWIQAGIASLSILLLIRSYSPDWYSIPFLMLSTIGLICLFATLIKIFELDANLSEPSTPLSISTIVQSITNRVTPMLLMLGLLFMFVLLPSSKENVTNIFLAGSLKAVNWVLLFFITQTVPWEIATTIWTAAASSTSTYVHSSASLQTVTHSIVTFAAVYQTISFLPRLPNTRYALLVFALWPLLSHVNTPGITDILSPDRIIGNQTSPIGIFPETQTELPLKQPSTTPIPLPTEAQIEYVAAHEVRPPTSVTTAIASPTPSVSHPIEHLIVKAKQDFAAMINRQSKTLEAAETEYRRRYSREPPPGFDKWFAYAQSTQSVIIDDFDIIHEALEPFYSISPQTLLASINYATGTEGKPEQLRKCGIKNGEFFGALGGDGGWIAADLGRMIEPIQHDLPDVVFAVDTLDEPMEIIDPKVVEHGGEQHPTLKDQGHNSIWKKVIGPCDESSPSKVALSKRDSTRIDDLGIPFVQSIAEAYDVCAHPEYVEQYGFFNSPTTALLTDAPVPILSQGTPSTFGDIVFPAPWYMAKYRDGSYKEDEDPSWEEKDARLYWAGSTTGGHSTNGTWKYGHRQRLIELVEHLNSTKHPYLEKVDNFKWEKHEKIIGGADGRKLFDIKFTGVIQCDTEDCKEQEKFFNIAERDPESQALKNKFVFDTDGNNFSRRFYTLLQSHSVVFKQTVLREWHDDRLIPWAHYVPIGLGMEELYESMRYLGYDERGQELAKELAVVSRDWTHKALRIEDFTIYNYRLMLELARVMDPSRVVEGQEKKVDQDRD